MHSLEAACNEAQNLINIFDSFGARTESCPSRSTQGSYTSLPGPSWSNGIHNQSLIEPSKKSRVFNIRQRLRELYLEECRNTQPYSSSHLPFKNLKRGSKLLEKLVQRDNLNTLIVNLYPGNKGYSLSLRLQGKVPAALGSQAGRSQGSEPVVETMRWPYSDEELLRCIDNEEIPATLVDLLETNHSELFYQGCVIAEIRDYRLTFPLYSFETHHVLLKPTTQSIINDVNIISSSQDFSAEDRLSLESQIVLATAPPLCLDPNPAVGILMNNLQHKKQRLSTAPLRRTARKFSQVTVNRKRKLDQFTSHNTLQLYDFITRKKAKLRSTNQLKQPKKGSEGALPPPPPVPSEEAVILQPPSIKPDVFKYAKHYEKSRETTDCSVHLIEEYILETERGQGRIYRIKLSILQRHSNMEYLGELYVDRDYKEGEKSGASCRFVLGTRVHANRYIQQFTEIFTEEGRKSVRITHVIPGQQHHVSYTPGMRERSAVAQAKKNAQSTPVGAHGKQPATINNTQNLGTNHNSNLQHILHNPQQLNVQAQHIEPNSANAINYNLNSQQIQKLHGQLTSGNANLLPQNPSTNSNIQINSVSHLTSLLANSNVTTTPNVNVHQIQQTQNVIGITGQSLGGLAQPVQNIVNVQNIGISNQNMNTSTIQSLLSSALNNNVLNDEGVNLMNGSTSSGVTGSHNTACNTASNATIHHQPSQNQPTTKPSRPPLATNPAISALVTSLMNSAQQFQVQQAAQQAANNSNSANVQTAANNITQSSTSSNNQNPTILSLLNATTPLSVNNNNVITTSHVNLGQQNQKLLTRKTITNLLSSRLINQNLSALLNNNVGNPTLVVNNANSQQLRVTLSSLNQLMNATNQSTVSSSQSPQILNIGNVNQISGSSSPGTGFTIATQATNLTTQTFTIANTDSQTFTITSPNPVQNQTYSLNSPTIGSLSQTQNQTFTITSNTGSLSPQSFTISSANSTNITNSNALTSAGFTLSPTQNSASQPQTFTVLQPNQNLTNQSFTITTPVGNQGFTVTNAQAAVGNQAFTISNTNLSSVQNKTFQINSAGTSNQTFTITTPVVTVANQFVNCQSPASTQTFTINAQSTQPTNTTSVLTVNSSLPNQVFTVNIQSPSSKPGFSQAYSNSSQLTQNKTLSPQNSVLINKNQTFTVNANKNFTVTAPVIAKNIDNGNNGKNNTTSASNNSGGNSVSGNSQISNSKSVKDGSNSNSSGSNVSNNNNNSNNNFNNNNNNSANSSGGVSRINAGRLATCQRRLSNALQQASQNSELNKLLLERCDNRLLMDAHKLVNDKSDSENPRLSQALSEKKLSESNKLCQALSCNADEGFSQNVGAAVHSSTSNLGLSMPGLSALLAGTPSADNPIPGASNSSSLLERLTSSAPNATAFNSPPLPAAPQSPSVSALSPNQNLNFQNSSFSASPNNNNSNNNNNNKNNNNNCNNNDNNNNNNNNNSNSNGNNNSSSNNSSNDSNINNNNNNNHNNDSKNNNSSNSNHNNNNNSNNNNNTFNSINVNSPSSNIMSPVPNFSSSSPKNQSQFQSPSPNSKEVVGMTSPLASPPGTAPVSLNLQGLNLQGITGLQNVQVSIPGLPVPILSLNVAGQGSSTQGVLTLPVSPTTNTMTTTSPSSLVVSNSVSTGSVDNVLSLPVAHLMTSEVKNPNQRTSTAGSISYTQGTPQSIQLVSSLHKPNSRPSVNQTPGNKSLQPLSPKGILNAQKNTLKSSGNPGRGNQMLAFTAQQQLQLANLKLQKQAQMQQSYQQNQKGPLSPSSLATKHRRRSNAADSNK